MTKWLRFSFWTGLETISVIFCFGSLTVFGDRQKPEIRQSWEQSKFSLF